jgi:hypothetical membrane protein
VQGSDDHRAGLIRLSAVLWLAAGISYLACEAVTASAVPGYRYARNYISDLGNPVVLNLRPVRGGSPLAALMNAGFIVHGILFASAGVLTSQAAKGGSRPRWFAGAALIHAAGLGLVAAFHSDRAAIADGTAVLHAVGAGVAIASANGAAIIGGSALGGFVARRIKIAGAVLGCAGLTSVLLLASTHLIGGVSPIDAAVWERGSVYTIIAWELLAAAAVLTRVRPTSTTASNRRNARDCSDA